MWESLSTSCGKNSLNLLSCSSLRSSTSRYPVTDHTQWDIHRPHTDTYTPVLTHSPDCYYYYFFLPWYFIPKVWDIKQSVWVVWMTAMGTRKCIIIIIIKKAKIIQTLSRRNVTGVLYRVKQCHECQPIQQNVWHQSGNDARNNVLLSFRRNSGRVGTALTDDGRAF